MKNQYVGDVNDYLKYGLIRMLTKNHEIPLTVCWMLTPDDNKNDGGKIEYLLKPKKWKECDQDLFDKLHEIVVKKTKQDVYEVENAGIIPNCTFFSNEMKTDGKLERENYFAEFDRHLENTKVNGENSEAKMIFFDPDNGIESRKAKPHRTKYIYESEIEKYFMEKKTLLLYQHFTREEQRQFIKSKAEQLMEITKAPKVYSFKTTNVVFFLVPYPGHDAEFEFERIIGEIKTSPWGTRIIPDVHQGHPETI